MTQTALVRESEIPAPATVLSDCSPEQQVEQRYLATLQALLDDALEHEHMDILVDTLTWNLARIGFACGAPALGDINRRLGAHVCDLGARAAAEREAAEAKKAGRMTQ